MTKTITIADTGIEDPILQAWGGLTDISDAVLDDSAIEAIDAEAVRRFSELGEPLEIAVRVRVYARVARTREEIFRKHGYVDLSKFRRPSTVDE